MKPIETLNKYSVQTNHRKNDIVSTEKLVSMCLIVRYFCYLMEPNKRYCQSKIHIADPVSIRI